MVELEPALENAINRLIFDFGYPDGYIQPSKEVRPEFKEGYCFSGSVVKNRDARISFYGRTIEDLDHSRILIKENYKVSIKSKLDYYDKDFYFYENDFDTSFEIFRTGSSVVTMRFRSSYNDASFNGFEDLRIMNIGRN